MMVTGNIRTRREAPQIPATCEHTDMHIATIARGKVGGGLGSHCNEQSPLMRLSSHGLAWLQGLGSNQHLTGEGREDELDISQ